jgi:pimeloyl-ACP methyl ester carboxylesterase
VPKHDTGESVMHYEQFGEGPDIVWIAGGGAMGSDWHRWQIPHFEGEFRNTTFDNRGIGRTECDAPAPWYIADFARDAASLIEAVCDPPVAVVGLSMGGFIVTQLALDRPDLLRCAISMGTAARGHTGWLGDYMRAEVELRHAGGRLDGMMATTHYAAELYPARALGDPQMWEQIKEFLGGDEFVEENERSLIPQWQACIDYDVADRLQDCRAPLHVFAFDQDVQAPPQYGKEVADGAPGAEYHLFEGMGHCSVYGHAHDRLNPEIERIIRRYL